MQRRYLAVGLIVATAFLALIIASARRSGPLVAPRSADLQAVAAAPVPVKERAASPGSAESVAAGPAAGPVAAAAARPTPQDAPAAVFAAFDVWSRQVAAGGAVSLDEGVALATARREVLRALIPADPARALAAAVPWSVRQTMPAEVVALLEEPVSAAGEFMVLCAFADAPWRREAQGGMLRYFKTEDRTWRAFVYGRRVKQQSVRQLAIHGIAVDDVLAIGEEAGRVLERAEADALAAAGRIAADARCALTGRTADAATRVVVEHGGEFTVLANRTVTAGFLRRLAAADSGFRRPTDPPVSPEWTLGRKTLLFMRVKFPDDPREPITEGEAHDVMSAANDYFVRASYNQLSVATTVGPLVTLPQPKMYYAAVGPGALLEDARAATAAAGFDFTAYDLDMVRHENVPGFTWGGLGAVGGRGAWLQGSGLGVIIHELGHNLGLAHANFWRTTRPPLPEDTQNLPFDSASRVGLDSVIGPGDDIEYGDPYDVMGGGPAPDGEYNALHKLYLSWIPVDNLHEVATNGQHRLYAHDAGRLFSGLKYALAVGKDPERNYWLSVRQNPAVNLGFNSRPGVELHWNGWHQSLGDTELLDTTPGTPAELQDARLGVGRTFADEEAQIFVTPVASFGLGLVGASIVDTNPPANPDLGPLPGWVDVVVNRGPFPSNRPPAVTLEAAALQVAPGQEVVFTAAATDEDGDRLAYWWDFGDLDTAPNAATASRSWGAPGDYVVRVEVSDLKGGVTSKHLVVRVGTVTTLRVTGQVVDNAGQPLAGVWVHNGLEGTNSLYAPGYAHALTDSDGAYTLVGLTNGAYDLAAHKYGHVVEPLNFSLPFQLDRFSGTRADLIAEPAPRVTAAKVADMDEGRGTPGVFRLTRDGATNDVLRVFFRLAGADADDLEPYPDFEVQTNTVETVFGPAAIPLEFFYADIPAGETGVDVSLTPLADGETEGPEKLHLTIAYPVSFVVTNAESTNYFDIPGWERRTVNGTERWHQTRPEYRLGHSPTADLTITDDRPAAQPVVSLVAFDSATSENAEDAAVVLLTRFGTPVGEELTVRLLVEGTATSGEDYRALATNVVIPAGRDFTLLRVEARSDSYVEGNETVLIRLVAQPGYTIGESSALVTIVDNDLPVVTAHAVAPRAAEAGGTGGIRFQRSGDLTFPLAVDYLLTGTATAGADYARPAGQITIPAGAAAATLGIAVLGDGVREGDETIVVTIGDSPLYNLGQPGRAVITILDAQTPTVTVSAPDNEAVEGGEGGQFRITRSPTSGALTVIYRFSGTARHQGDFIASGGSVTIPSGQAGVNIDLTTINDAFREDDELAVLELLPDPAYQIGEPGQAAVAIQDDDGGAQPAVGFALLTSSAPESAGEVNLAVQVSANPAEGDENIITVEYDVLGGTAARGVDYVLDSGTVTFAYVDPDSDDPYINRVVFIPLTITEDVLLETDETVVVRLRLAGTTNAPAEPGPGDPIDTDADGVFDACDTDGDGQPDVVGECPGGTPADVSFNGLPDVYLVHALTIRDNDRGLVSVAASTNILREGGSSGAFLISRTGGTAQPATVVLQVHGTAVAGSDFAALPNFVTFAPGVASVTLPVVPLDDPVQEYREEIRLTLLAAPGYALGEVAATITIEDNDGTIEFTALDHYVNEADGVAEILVRRTSDTTTAAVAAYEALAGTAVPGGTNNPSTGDFLPVSGLLEFAPGELTKTFAVPLINNTNRNFGDRTVRLRLSRASGLFPLGGQSTATLHIADDDGAPADLEITAEDTDFEAGDGARFTVRRRGDATPPLTLLYFTQDGTATSGTDYEPVPAGVLEFAAGQEAAEFRVPFLDDAEVEEDEQFEVVLTDASGVPLVTLVLTIENDDTLIEFGLANPEVNEDAGVIEISVRRRGFTAPAMLVDFASSNLTAVAGADFEAATGTLTFLGDRTEPATDGSGSVIALAGETNKVIAVRILNDDAGELDERFLLALLNPRLASPPGTGTIAFGTNVPAVVTIKDNEAPGEVDEGFNPGLGADALVRAVAVQEDGKVVIAGDFSTVNGTVLPRVARLHNDGLVDNSFNPGRGLDGPPYALAVLRDGRVLAGGAFTNAGQVPRRFLVRFEADGSSLPGPNVPAPNGVVRALAALPDGGALVGGDFTAVGGQPRGGVARLRPDSSLDPDFLPGPGAAGGVRALAADADGRSLVGGGFRNYDGSGLNHLVRLDVDGRLDASWLGASPNGVVHAVAVQSDGRILLGGAFTEVGRLPRRGVARLNGDGTVDVTFDPGEGPDGPVFAVADGGEGRVLVAGGFGTVDGEVRGGFARLAADGTVDADFAGPGANGAVHGLALQADGAFFIGGAFTEVNGLPRRRIARIHGDDKFLSGQVQFSASAYEVGEGAGRIVVDVLRSGSAKEAATVDYRAAPGTAGDPGDFLATLGTLRFAAGQTNATFTVTIQQDSLAEGDETFRLDLTNAAAVNLGRRSAAIVTIVDDEAAVAFTVLHAEVEEGATNVVLTLRRTGDLSVAAQLQLETADGTARTGEDYSATQAVVEFAAGVESVEIAVAILDDDVLEDAETFTVTITGASPPPLAVGTQGEVVVTILDNDSPPTSWLLAVQPADGGTVAPAGGRFPTNSVVTVTATPQRDYEFVQWEGTVASADNPLQLLMDRDHVLTARFRPREYLETFEGGSFGGLPWQFGGEAAWTITDVTAAGGRFSARSGLIGHSQSSRLILDYETGPGAGTFDYRVSSEADWDWLEFWVDGARVAKWAGEVPWQTHTFNVTAGRHRFEWRYARDRNFVGGQDAAWIDNLDLPAAVTVPTGALPAPTLALTPRAGGGMVVKVLGQSGRSYTLEASADMRTWRPVATQVMSGALLFIEDTEGRSAIRFYRALAK
ncbi:MAG: Calx-beta domain-containing protein [Limisphaerales bacterium]